MLRGLLRRAFQSPVEREREFYRRYRELSDTIDAMPDSITHYVLRGELMIERGEYGRAEADFVAAVELAKSADPGAGWGAIEQIMCDRALQGIKLARRRS